MELGAHAERAEHEVGVRHGRWSVVGRISVSSGSWTTKFAGAADRLARRYWDGGALVEDGFFDIQDQQMRHSAYDESPAFEVGFSFGVTEGPEQ